MRWRDDTIIVSFPRLEVEWRITREAPSGEWKKKPIGLNSLKNEGRVSGEATKTAWPNW